MKNKYSYYEYDGVPCRITHDEAGREVSGEIYKSGEGLKKFSVTEILFKAVPVSKDEFNNLLIRFTKSGG